jgi:glutathione S-transferase
LGQLPYFTISGTKLPQSIAIARFAAKKANLYGSNELEQAKTDAVVDTVSDLQTALYTKVFAAKEAEREAAKKAFLSDEAAAHFEKIEKLIKLWGSNGYSVGSSLKWSDLAIWNFTSELKAIDANILAKYPGIVGVNKSVDSNSKVSEYVKNRPATPF